MLSLVLIVIIFSNVILWSQQMNQYDWERNQESIEIVNASASYSEILFTLENKSPITVHIVGIWVNNATNHQRYATDIFINPGNTESYTLDNVALPSEPYEVKVITERGNAALLALTIVSFPSDWHYYKSHVINSQSGAGTGYQTRVVVHLGSGSDLGENVYLNGKCQADFDDIRFTSSDGTTLLDYWKESSNDEEAVFWVRLTDNLSNSNCTIYLYYGADAAGSLSNGVSTFPALFTDFDGDSLPEGWQVDGDTFGTMNIEDSLLKLTGEAGSSGTWKQRGVSTTSPVWQNDQALMYRVDSMNYYPTNDRHLWYLGGEAYNYYVEFYSYGDVINVRDYNVIDYYSPANWTGDEVIWLAKQSGNNGNAFYYLNGTLIEIIDGTGLHPTHQFPDLTVYFKARQGASAIPNVDYVNVDWVAIRNFVYPEPTHGEWGEEVSI
jgi:hypothetical protein